MVAIRSDLEKNQMKDQETVQKFIELRAQGWSFVRIPVDLGVAKSTLTEWSRKFTNPRLRRLSLNWFREHYPSP